MADEKFDVIVVGAGPSGNACALTLAQRGLSVLQLERGEYPGSKNVQGAILYANALEKLDPGFPRGCAARAAYHRAADLDDGRPLLLRRALSLG